MRSTIGLGVLLAGCAAASAQEVRPPLRTMPSLLSESPVAERDREDALARQAAMDKRMDVRTRRAIGSVCVGCSGPAPRPMRVKPRVADAEEPDAASAFDPAEAPVE